MSEKFDIGSLKHTVVFKKNARGSLGFGSKDNYETFLITRCSKERKRATKQNERGQVQIATFYLMRCRFQEDLLTNLSGSAIAVISGVTHVIHSFDLIDEKEHLYEFIISKSSG
jgi:hypothetical protein